MARLLPVDPTLSAQAFTTTLGNARFRARVFWVPRSASWYLHLEDTDGNRIVSGMRVVSGFPMTDQYEYLETLPVGAIVPLDMEGNVYYDIARDDLGDRHLLFFVPDDERETYGLVF